MICPNCGSEVEDGIKFCPNCGAEVSGGNTTETGNDSSFQNTEDSSDALSSGEVQQAETTTDYSNSQAVNDEGFSGTGSGTNRNIVLGIVLFFITCGIYGLYWMYVLNEEINSLSGENEATGGGMVILFSIITCGIYGYFWAYKMGERVDRIKTETLGMSSSSSSIVFLILAIFGLHVVNFALMQDTVNKVVG